MLDFRYTMYCNVTHTIRHVNIFIETIKILLFRIKCILSK